MYVIKQVTTHKLKNSVQAFSISFIRNDKNYGIFGNYKNKVNIRILCISFTKILCEKKGRRVNKSQRYKNACKSITASFLQK